MALFRKNLIVIEARQLAGTAIETMDVIDWVRNRGEYPWLLGNAMHPETLVAEGGDPSKPGVKGVYLDPADGSLVIREPHRDKRASYGDWVVFHEDDVVEVFTPQDFRSEYNPA